MSPVEMPKRLIVGITGATGIVYGIRALQVLRSLGIETHLVISRAGELTREYETAYSRAELHALADQVYPINDVGAPSPAALSGRWGCSSPHARCAHSPRSRRA